MEYVVVEAPAGKIRGRVFGRVRVFRGIPYASAARLRPSQPRRPLEGVFHATMSPVIAPQNPSNLEGPMGPVVVPQREDCLRLEIFAPEAKRPLPVAVWLHGWANVSGGGALPWYDGEILSRETRVVVVNVSFRLGALGFLFVPGVSESNLSIGDQILALRWVQQNIAAFGGDPGSVTVFGQSAGANAALHLAMLPETRGLFHRLILQSPSIGRGNLTKAKAAAIGAQYLKALGISPGDPGAGRSALEAKGVDEMLEAMKRHAQKCKPVFGSMLFMPVADAWARPEDLIGAAARELSFRRMPVLIGTTSEEALAFSLDRSTESLRELAEMQSERFDEPALAFARAVSGAGVPLWKYRFIWTPPGSPYGSCHCIELPYLFGNARAWKNAPFIRGESPGAFESVGRELRACWGRFMRGEAEGPGWPRFRPGEPFVQILPECTAP